MFLIRTAFWLAVIVALVPVDEERVSATSPDLATIGAGEAMVAAQALAADLGGFCGRNPDVCEVGDKVAVTMMLKAKTGALMVYEYLGGTLPGTETRPEMVTMPVPAAFAGTGGDIARPPHDA